METIKTRTVGVCFYITALLVGGGCQDAPPDTGLLGANLLSAAVNTLQRQRETIALSGRLRVTGGVPLGHARVTFAPATGAAAWSCVTDANGFWNLDLAMGTQNVSFTATVEKDFKKIAVFLIEIGIEGGTSRPRVQVSTSVLSGDIEAEAAAYVRSTLLVSGNAPLLPEGTGVDLKLKFNQSQTEERAVRITSNDESRITIDGLSQQTVLFTASDATVDHTVRVEALVDGDVLSESVVLTISAEGLPDVLVTFVIQDADIPSMVVSGTTAVSENNGSSVLMVRPAFIPDEEMTFTLTSEDGTRLSVSPASLTFTPADYLTARAVTVTGIADADFTTDEVGVIFTAPELAQSIRVPVLVTDTTPLFTAPVSFGSTAGSAATLCDLNGDALADTVQADAGAALLRVRPNASIAGNVAFGSESTHGITAPGGFGLSCADFDGDGKADLTIAHRSAGQLEILRNTSAGSISFAAGVSIPVGSGPVATHTIDLDGDGRPDLVSADRDANTITVLVNTSTPGSISFAATTIATGVRPAFLGHGDFNLDGRPDLVIVHEFSATTSITVLPNTSSPGSVSFGTPTVIGNLSGFGLLVSDLNGDGKSEIMTITDSGTRLRILTPQPGNPFAFTVSQLESGMDGIVPVLGSSLLAAADLDGDGLPELLFANPLDARAGVFRNLGLLSFSKQHFFMSGTTPLSAFAANLDGAGRTDALFFGTGGAWLALRSLLP